VVRRESERFLLETSRCDPCRPCCGSSAAKTFCIGSCHADADHYKRVGLHYISIFKSCRCKCRVYFDYQTENSLNDRDRDELRLKRAPTLESRRTRAPIREGSNRARHKKGATRVRLREFYRSDAKRPDPGRGHGRSDFWLCTFVQTPSTVCPTKLNVVLWSGNPEAGGRLVAVIPTNIIPQLPGSERVSGIPANRLDVRRGIRSGRGGGSAGR
jgi:hypothetical protein